MFWQIRFHKIKTKFKLHQPKQIQHYNSLAKQFPIHDMVCNVVNHWICTNETKMKSDQNPCSLAWKHSGHLKWISYKLRYQDHMALKWPLYNYVWLRWWNISAPLASKPFMGYTTEIKHKSAWWEWNWLEHQQRVKCNQDEPFQLFQ